MPTQPLGWFKKEVKGPDSFKGLKYRTVGLASDVMQAMGAQRHPASGPEIMPAMERGVIDGVRVQQSDLRPALRRPGRRQELHAGHATIRPRSPSRSSTTRPSMTAWPRSSRPSSSSPRGRLAPTASGRRGTIYSKDLRRCRPSTGSRSSARRRRSSTRSSPRGTRSPDQRRFAARTFLQEGDRLPEGVGASASAVYALNNEADFKSAYEHYFGKLKV